MGCTTTISSTKAQTSPNVPHSWVPDWLIKNLGVDYFHHVTWAHIEDPKFNDEDLSRLTACLPRIESMGIVGTSITDGGLTHLRGNRSLLALFVSSNSLTDAGIDNLGPHTLPVLDLLDVRGTGVSAAKVADVEAIFNVREAAAKKAHPKQAHLGTHGALGLSPAKLPWSRPAGRVRDEHRPQTIRAVETISMRLHVCAYRRVRL